MAVLAILMFIGGGLDIVVAALLLVLGAVKVPVIAVIPSFQLEGILLQLLSVGIVAVGVISFLLGYGLWKGQPWAWTWTFISSNAGLIVSIAGVIFGIGIVGLVVYSNFIYYLTRPGVRSYFGKGAVVAGEVAAPPLPRFERRPWEETIVAGVTQGYQEQQPKFAARTGETQKLVEMIDAEFRSKLAGVLFLVAWAQSVYFSTIAEGLYPNYNLQTNLVSDLGVQPQSALLWSASVFVTGALVIVASLVLSDYGKKHRLLLVTFVLTAVGLMGLAGFNENAFHDLHLILSFIAFAFGGISSLLACLGLVKGLFRFVSVILGGMMVIGVVILYAGFFFAPVASVFFALGQGFAERTVLLPESIWFIAFGAYLMGTARVARQELPL